jgi:hypothetical protein
LVSVLVVLMVAVWNSVVAWRRFRLAAIHPRGSRRKGLTSRYPNE